VLNRVSLTDRIER